MKKTMKKTVATVLTLLMASSMVACGGGNTGNGGTEGDIYNVSGPDKVQINFLNRNGGCGTRWIKELAEEYAKRNVNTDYGDGKTGVYIEVTPASTANPNGISATNNHIMVYEQQESPRFLASGGELYDLNEIYFDETRVGGTLDSKIFDGVKSNFIGNDGHYYGLPQAEFYGGCSYNRDVFEDAGAFLASETASSSTVVKFTSSLTGKEYKFTTTAGQLSDGPDGEFGTEDDGLPATMEEFVAMMEFIKKRTVYYPMCISGAHNYYSVYLFEGMWASLAGAEQMRNYYNCDGEIEVVELNADGSLKLKDEPIFAGVTDIKKPYTKKITLNAENGYLGHTMAAKYYATALFEIMKDNQFFSPEASSDTVSHYDAQLAFMTGEACSFSNSAMLCEASYWYNETVDGKTFAAAELNTGKKQAEFDVRIMPLPSAFDSNDTRRNPTSFIEIGGTTMVVNGRVKGSGALEKAVVDFVKFIYSEEQLKATTISTGMTRSIEINMTDDEINQMDGLYKYLYKLRKEDGSNIVFNAGTTTAYALNNALLKNTLNYNRCQNPFENVPAKGTAEYFKGYFVAKEDWKVAEAK